MWNILKSKDDQSVNFTKKYHNGLIECRYVRRVGDYFIVYLSSHSGCNYSCRFCHLTATGQTSFDSVTPEEYYQQARTVMEYYKTINIPANKVHFNFMARGEPLANEYISSGHGPEIINGLQNIANEYNVHGSSRISTIMPNTITEPLKYYIGLDNVIPYYSLYSINQDFRKRWIPKSLPVVQSLDILKEWQLESNKHVVIHMAFIENENDDYTNINYICDELISRKLISKLNIVRYNPYNKEKYGNETSNDNLENIKNIFIERMGKEKLLYKNTRIVPRVGFDVNASCGMFVNE